MYLGEVVLVVGLEEPLNRGSGGDLPPQLAGDAAQLEVLIGDRLGVRVHLHTCPPGLLPWRREENIRTGELLTSLTSKPNCLHVSGVWFKNS